MTEEFTYQPESVREIEPSSIIVPERQRQSYDPKFIEELAASIMEVGQLQPGVCYNSDEGITLIAGENRRRACSKLGVKFKYILKEDLTDDYSIKAAELYENLCRNNLTWQEEDKAMAELHKLREEQHGKPQRGRYSGQTLEKTAAELKSSRRKLARAIEIEPFLSIPEIRDAKSRQEGYNKFQAILASYERETQVQEALKTKASAPSAEATAKATQLLDSKPTTSSSDETDAAVLHMLAQYAERVQLGKFEEAVPELAPESYDIVIFDPPWGVDYDKVMHDTGSTTKYSDSAEKFQEDFPKWVETLYSKMAIDSHLYLFFGITWHEFVYNTLEAAGFSTNRMPLFWHKRGAGRTRNPDIWPGRSYEAIAYARKGNKILQLKGKPDIIQTAAPTRKMKLSHPSAKHPDIIKDLIMRSAVKHDKVLDPMAGSGMTGVACEHPDLKSLKLDWQLIEMSEEFVNLAIWNLGRGYYSIIGEDSPAEPALSAEEKAKITYDQWERDHPAQETYLPDDFRELEICSAEWKEYWKAHPEMQADMLDWKKSGGQIN